MFRRKITAYLGYLLRVIHIKVAYSGTKWKNSRKDVVASAPTVFIFILKLLAQHVPTAIVKHALQAWENDLEPHRDSFNVLLVQFERQASRPQFR